jgi:hypothetical protein
MNLAQKLNDPVEIIAAIRETLRKANREASSWDCREPERDEMEAVTFFLERGYTQLLAFLEAAGFPETYKAVADIKREAEKDYSKTECYSEGMYLVWAAKLDDYLLSLDSLFGKDETGRIVKEVVDILRATQYSITDLNCFQQAPQNEAQVHNRIEAVLRCVFTDLEHKPTISKPIKSFVPDTGIPSLKTLIEYKFIQSRKDMKRVVDEVLADTRGYVSQKWNKFIYVIYETRRLKPESDWRRMLRKSEISESTEIIVLCGESPNPSQPLVNPMRRRSAPKKRLASNAK